MESRPSTAEAVQVLAKTLRPSSRDQSRFQLVPGLRALSSPASRAALAECIRLGAAERPPGWADEAAGAAETAAVLARRPATAREEALLMLQLAGALLAPCGEAKARAFLAHLFSGSAPFDDPELALACMQCAAKVASASLSFGCHLHESTVSDMCAVAVRCNAVNVMAPLFTLLSVTGDVAFLNAIRELINDNLRDTHTSAIAAFRVAFMAASASQIASIASVYHREEDADTRNGVTRMVSATDVAMLISAVDTVRTSDDGNTDALERNRSIYALLQWLLSSERSWSALEHVCQLPWFAERCFKFCLASVAYPCAPRQIVQLYQTHVHLRTRILTQLLAIVELPGANAEGLACCDILSALSHHVPELIAAEADLLQPMLTKADKVQAKIASEYCQAILPVLQFSPQLTQSVLSMLRRLLSPDTVSGSTGIPLAVQVVGSMLLQCPSLLGPDVVNAVMRQPPNHLKVLYRRIWLRLAPELSKQSTRGADQLEPALSQALRSKPFLAVLPTLNGRCTAVMTEGIIDWRRMILNTKKLKDNYRHLFAAVVAASVALFNEGVETAAGPQAGQAAAALFSTLSSLCKSRIPPDLSKLQVQALGELAVAGIDCLCEFGQNLPLPEGDDCNSMMVSLVQLRASYETCTERVNITTLHKLMDHFGGSMLEDADVPTLRAMRVCILSLCSQTTAHSKAKDITLSFGLALRTFVRLNAIKSAQADVPPADHVEAEEDVRMACIRLMMGCLNIVGSAAPVRIQLARESERPEGEPLCQSLAHPSGFSLCLPDALADATGRNMLIYLSKSIRDELQSGTSIVVVESYMQLASRLITGHPRFRCKTASDTLIGALGSISISSGKCIKALFQTALSMLPLAERLNTALSAFDTVMRNNDAGIGRRICVLAPELPEGHKERRNHLNQLHAMAIPVLQVIMSTFSDVFDGTNGIALDGASLEDSPQYCRLMKKALKRQKELVTRDAYLPGRVWRWIVPSVSAVIGRVVELVSSKAQILSNEQPATAEFLAYVVASGDKMRKRMAEVQGISFTAALLVEFDLLFRAGRAFITRCLKAKPSPSRQMKKAKKERHPNAENVSPSESSSSSSMQKLDRALKEADEFDPDAVGNDGGSDDDDDDEQDHDEDEDEDDEDDGADIDLTKRGRKRGKRSRPKMSDDPVLSRLLEDGEYEDGDDSDYASLEGFLVAD